jgi:hypothetical protein
MLELVTVYKHILGKIGTCQIIDVDLNQKFKLKFVHYLGMFLYCSSSQAVASYKNKLARSYMQTGRHSKNCCNLRAVFSNFRSHRYWYLPEVFRIPQFLLTDVE